MKNFNIILYSGGFVMDKDNMLVLDNMTIAAENYNSNELFKAAQELVKKNNLEYTPYYRCAMAENGIYIDFGSWNKFIFIEEQ